MPQASAAFIVLHRKPAHPFDVLAPILREKLASRNFIVHVIAYRCIDPSVVLFAQDLARLCQGRFHVFHDAVSAHDNTVSDDVRLLLTETQTAHAVLALLAAPLQATMADAALRTARDHDALLGVPRMTRAQILQDLARSGSLSKKVHTPAQRNKDVHRNASATKPPQHNVGQDGGITVAPRLSSKDWISTHGIKACKLEIYDVLAGVAYSCSKPGLYLGDKYKSMAKLMWKDGTEKTVYTWTRPC